MKAPLNLNTPSLLKHGLLGLSALAISTTLHAREPGGYVGFQIASTDWATERDSLLAAPNTLTGGIDEVASSDSYVGDSYGILFGNQFHEYMGVEVGYRYHNNVNSNVEGTNTHTGDYIQLIDESHVQSGTAAIVAFAPINPTFSGVLKVGYEKWDMDSERTVLRAPTSGSNSSTKTDFDSDGEGLFFGAGIEIHASRRASVNVGFEKHEYNVDTPEFADDITGEEFQISVQLGLY